MKLEMGKVHHLISFAAAAVAAAGAASKEALHFSHKIAFIFVEEQIAAAADDSTAAT